MNTIQDYTMRRLIAVTGEAIAAMESIPATSRPDGFSAAIGRLSWAYDKLLEVAVAPVAVEPAREVEAA